MFQNNFNEKPITEGRVIEWVEPKTVLYYSGAFRRDALRDLREYADELVNKGIKVKTYHHRCELVTEKVRVRFITGTTVLNGLRVDEVFNFYNPETAKHLRKNHSDKGFVGSLTSYVVLAHTMGTV